MARIRSVKPDLFTSAAVAGVPRDARLTFVGLWCYADDHGLARDDPRLVKAAVWPQDDDMTWQEVDAHLDALAAAGLITRYTARGKRYLHLPSWYEHQKVPHPARTHYPAPPGWQPTEQGGIEPAAGLHDPCEDPSKPPHPHEDVVSPHEDVVSPHEDVVSPHEDLTPEVGSRNGEVGSRNGEVGAGKSRARARGPGRPPEPAEPPPRRKRAQQLPGDWQPTAEHRRLAAELRLDIDDQLALFRDHWLSKAEPRADWNATFRNWLRRAPSFGGGARASPLPMARSDQMAAAYRAAAEHARRGAAS